MTSEAEFTAYQASRDLETDGTFGRASWAVLKNDISTQDQARERIKALQDQLRGANRCDPDRKPHRRRQKLFLHLHPLIEANMALTIVADPGGSVSRSSGEQYGNLSLHAHQYICSDAISDER